MDISSDTVIDDTIPSPWRDMEQMILTFKTQITSMHQQFRLLEKSSQKPSDPFQQTLSRTDE